MSNDLIISEVHLAIKQPERENSDDFAVSSFKYCNGEKIPQSGVLLFDEDGDLVRDDEMEKVIKIKHKNETNLAMVGCQIWRGGLFLADFILQNPGLTNARKVLEIGAGTGITSIVCHKNTNASRIVMTDIFEVVDVLKENSTLNECGESLSVQVFDLCQPENYAQFEDFDVILAADLIYDNDITDGVIQFLTHMLNRATARGPCQFLFAIDKRYIFTTEDLDTVAPSYEYFMAKVLDLPCHIEEILEVDVKQSICYERSRDLCIVRIIPK